MASADKGNPADTTNSKNLQMWYETEQFHQGNRHQFCSYLNVATWDFLFAEINFFFLAAQYL